ncbi:YhgE/Pip domain-containing protein [Rhodoferax lacus]|uniref:YhgE/Pip domain-containing protein n=1 Tax=Rhodoferax lacus TaxID=2184758 RepID=A0A3E1RDT9_9BURK|nr:YhgE/Pip domain-containing protein [Rhodoferax lacus]RFO97529.1 YhgE/Pip domain-containing protein [Rhodoferax lacus]
MKYLPQQILFVLRLELQFFLRFPKLIAATLMVVLIPALYAFIYLSSMWDPASRINTLPVGLVNLDAGVEYRGQVFNAGWEVANTLRRRQTFGFKDFDSEGAARQAVRSGALAFALIIPPDFSSNAIPGHEAGAGKLTVVSSEGNNFESALLARNFARELGHDVNESLNERRWKLVLLNAAGSQRSVDRLREGVEQLQIGAHELSKGMLPLLNGARQAATGSQRVNSGVDQLSSGVKQLGGGLRTLDAKRPRNSELDKLKTGAEQLAAGHEELGRGMAELQTGSQGVRSSVASFRDQARDSLLVPSKVGDNLDLLLTGVTQLDTGLHAASDAQGRLSDGADKLSSGVGALTTGVRAMNLGVRSMVQKLPEESQLDELDHGTDTLASGTAALATGVQASKQGADRLSAGLDLLATSLPADVDKPDGSAQGLANSVSPVVEMEAPVANSGSAFAPNILPAALWLGAGVAAFLIHVRSQPKHALHFSNPAKLAGKIAIPTAVVLLQAAMVYATVVWGLHIRIAEPGLFTLTLCLSSVTFLCIVIALTRVMGDAGKALSMIFLAVQLSSSGGILPVELSGTLFSEISPWLPLTWVVRAMKISMFGAYGGEWQHPMSVIALTCGAALVSACWLGRWRYVRPSAMRPAVDF